MNDMDTSIEEKEKLDSSKINDNSYTVLENILYCSSPKRGIKSESNIKTKSYVFTPITSDSDMNATRFTFNIFKEASTDIGSKEEMVNSQKSSNLISDFSISNIKNTNLNNITNENKNNSSNQVLSLSLKKDTEEEKKIIENEEKEEKCKKRKKRVKNKYYSSKLDELIFGQNKEKYKNKTERKKNDVIDSEINKNKEKKIRIKNKRYESINLGERELKNKNKNIKDSIQKYCSIDLNKDTNNKKKMKYYEDELINDEKDKMKNKNKNHKKEKKFRNIFNISKSLKYPTFQNELMKDKKRNNSNSPFIDKNENNFEEKNCISHPIKNDKEDKNLQNNIFLIKSTKYISQNKYSLLKEIDRDYEDKIPREIKSAKKAYNNFRRQNKNNKKHYTDAPSKHSKYIEEKDKEISDFCNCKIKTDKKIKEILNKCSSNLFRKANNKNDKALESEIFRTKKSAPSDITLEGNKEKDYKLKSSITLTKKNFHKKSVKIKDNPNKNLLQRRYTIYEINNSNKMNINYHNKNRINKKNNSSFDSEGDENNENEYKDNCSYKNDRINEKEMKMKIDKITEDKLILNYKNKNETIEVLSDKENMDNFYEYLELCLETLQEINLKEVPKSKANINFKFPKDKQNKKIALFDLDETLVHCIGEIKKEDFNKQEYENAHKINVILPSKKEVTIAINIRPHLEELLDKIKDIYNIVIFTASHRSYSDAVLNYLDPEDKYFHYRLYRDSCVQYRTNDINFYVKDLDIFKYNYDLKDIIIIDNSILSFAYHLNNGIPVVPFYDSKQDSELPLLSFYLLSIASYQDLREANKEHINLFYFLNETKKEMSFDEVTKKDNISIKDNKNNNLIINNIKMNINENQKNIIFTNNKNYNRLNSDINNNQNLKFKKEEKEKDMNFNKSEKKLIIGSQRNRNNSCRKKFNTVKIESFRILDFFEKWKNAYLQLALKK